MRVRVRRGLGVGVCGPARLAPRGRTGWRAGRVRQLPQPRSPGGPFADGVLADIPVTYGSRDEEPLGSGWPDPGGGCPCRKTRDEGRRHVQGLGPRDREGGGRAGLPRNLQNPERTEFWLGEPPLGSLVGAAPGHAHSGAGDWGSFHTLTLGRGGRPQAGGPGAPARGLPLSSLGWWPRGPWRPGRASLGPVHAESHTRAGGSREQAGTQNRGACLSSGTPEQRGRCPVLGEGRQAALGLVSHPAPPSPAPSRRGRAQHAPQARGRPCLLLVTPAGHSLLLHER